MPSQLHEVMIQIFRNRPSLAAELLREALGVDVPGFEAARVEQCEFTDLAPTEYRADAVVTLTAADRTVLAVVVEVQLGRDKGKRWSWPVYVSTLRARLRCPVVLLVLCLRASTARWCAEPISMGHPGWVLAPLVIGPDEVPIIADAAEAVQAPELAVLSAVARGGGPDGVKVLDTLPHAFAALDGERATLYADVVFAALPAAARRYLEEIMRAGTYEYQSDFVRQYVFQGRAEAQAHDVLAVLEAREVDVPDDARARIASCTDLDQLGVWIRRAATATSIDDLFG